MPMPISTVPDIFVSNKKSDYKVILPIGVASVNSSVFLVEKDGKKYVLKLTRLDRDPQGDCDPTLYFDNKISMYAYLETIKDNKLLLFCNK